jgi:signal recognition particle receptor subunit beta
MAKRMKDFFSLDTDGDCTYFFDLLPLNLGKIHDRDIRVKIYTVPGQVMYEKTRRMVLSGADAVVFVADSEKKRRIDNKKSLVNLAENLMANKLNIRTIPLVFQYNKQDLPDVHTGDFLDKDLNFRNVPSHEAAAILLSDYGVLNCFIDVLKSLMDVVAEKLRIDKNSDEIINVKKQLEKTLRASM